MVLEQRMEQFVDSLPFSMPIAVRLKPHLQQITPVGEPLGFLKEDGVALKSGLRAYGANPPYEI